MIINPNSIINGKVEEYIDEYHSKLSTIIESIRSNDGVKVHVNVDLAQGGLDFLHCSLLLSDLVTVGSEGHQGR